MGARSASTPSAARAPATSTSRSSGCRRTLSDAPRRAVHAPCASSPMLVCCLRCLRAPWSPSTLPLYCCPLASRLHCKMKFVLLPAAAASHQVCTAPRNPCCIYCTCQTMLTLEPGVAVSYGASSCIASSRACMEVRCRPAAHWLPRPSQGCLDSVFLRPHPYCCFQMPLISV